MRGYTVHAGEAAPRVPARGELPAADGARLRGHRDLQHAAQEVSRLHATRKPRSIPPTRATSAVEWEADIVNAFRNSRRGTTRGQRRARHARRPHALPRAPDPDQGPGLPRLPQRARGRARLDDQALRREQRLRLEAQGDHRRAGGVGADVAADQERQQGLRHVHGLARGDLRGDLHRAERHAVGDDHPADRAACRPRRTRSRTGDFNVPEFRQGQATRSARSARRSTACAAACRRRSS